MKNLNKLKKAELIKQFKELQNKDNNSLFSIIINFISNFKGWILKLTLIAFLIKIVKKYSIFRRLWQISNWISMTLLGFSIADLWGIEYLSGLWDWIKSNPLTQVFKSKVEELPTKIEEFPSKMGGINKNSTRIQETNERVSWSDRWNDRRSEPEIVDDNTPIYKNKYVITAAILALLAVSWWYFQDDINPIIQDGIEKLQIFRPRTNSNSTNVCSNPIQPIEGMDQSGWWKSIKDKVKSLWSKDNKPKDKYNPPSEHEDIECITTRNSSILSELKGTTLDRNYQSELNNLPLYDAKGKGIDLANLSEAEQTRRLEIMSKQLYENRLVENMTGMTEDRFNNQVETLLSKINLFNNTEYFPTESLKIGMHGTLLAELMALKHLNKKYFNPWLENAKVKEAISHFLYSNPSTASDDTELKDLKIKLNEIESETYDEIALATVKEQDVWSDRASIQSPISIHDNFSENAVFDPIEQTVEPELKVKDNTSTTEALYESISARKDDANVISDVESGKFNIYQAGLTPHANPIIITQEVDTLDQALDINWIIEEEKQIRKIQPLMEQPAQPIIEPQPITTKASTPESADRLFKKTDVLGELIDDAKVLSDQKILENVQKSFSEPIVEDKPRMKFSNLLDAIKARRTEVDESITKSLKKQEVTEDLSTQIKSKGADFNSPIIETRDETLRQIETLTAQPNVDTPKSALSVVLDTVKGLLSPKASINLSETGNLFDDTNALFDAIDDDNASKPASIWEELDWHNVSAKVGTGVNLEDRNIEIDFKDPKLANSYTGIEISLNDGYTENYRNLGKGLQQRFIWDTRGITIDSDKLDVYVVAIIDNEGGRHTIYKNHDVVSLPYVRASRNTIF